MKRKHNPGTNALTIFKIHESLSKPPPHMMLALGKKGRKCKTEFENKNTMTSFITGFLFVPLKLQED